MGLLDGLKKKKDNQLFNVQWEYYMSHCDNPHVVRFDISLNNLTDDMRKRYPHTIELRVPFTEDGDQVMRIKKIEENFSVVSYDVRYIGVLTYGDCKVFSFCCEASAENDFNSIVQTLMASNKNIDYSFEVFSNDNLRYYDEILAPSLYERQWIENNHLCNHLENKGDNLSKPRTIDFFLYFASPQHIQDIADKLCEQGFNEISREKSKGGEYLLELTLEDIPSFDRINEITIGILDLLDGTDGYFDGWGCPVEIE